jgi:hypothetical protein
MATTIITKQHDTKITFTDSPTIDDVPLPFSSTAGCTLSFLLKNETKQIKQVAMISDDGGNARYSYDPIATDVDTEGKYKQEWELVYPTGKILTFPNNGYNIVKIIADLG